MTGSIWGTGVGARTVTRRFSMAAVLLVWLATGRVANAAPIPLGSSALFPAFSAKEILEKGASVGDGLYWFDPDGPGGNEAFLGWADMTTQGGGWNLALLSLAGSPSSTTDIVSNTGTPGLGTGHTRDMTLLAVTQEAEIRHQIVSSISVFDGYYTGSYHDPLGAAADWTFLSGHTNTALLSYHFGRPWSTASNDQDESSANCAEFYGVPWYYGACWVAIPVQASGSEPLAPAGKYAIWVRASGDTLYEDPNQVSAVPEPTSMLLLASGLAAVACARRRLRRI